MAYVNQNDKAEVSPAIKAVLKKYGMKGSISIRNHMTLVVTLKSGRLDLIGNWYNTVTKNGDRNIYGDKYIKPDYMDVNTYWIDNNYSGEVKSFLNELQDAMLKKGWRDNSDIQSDYFDITYYIDISVGTWNKPYQFEG